MIQGNFYGVNFLAINRSNRKSLRQTVKTYEDWRLFSRIKRRGYPVTVAVERFIAYKSALLTAGSAKSQYEPG